MRFLNGPPGEPAAVDRRRPLSASTETAPGAPATGT